jgi:hypothetical protein
MKIQIASDLHLEFLARNFPGETLIRPAPEADLLALVGDISQGLHAIATFANWPVPVLYVPGNHEFYGHHWEQLREAMRKAAFGTSVVVMDNTVADLSGFTDWAQSRKDELSRVRFLGATMWTDYRYRAGRTQEQLMSHAERHLADHYHIQTNNGTFTAKMALADHEKSRAWLAQELAKPFEGRTVVLSHHGPHPLSVHPKYLAANTVALNAAFVSDLSDLMARTDLWLHGHVHDSFDYRIGRCRVIANPRGYAFNARNVEAIADLKFENPAFAWTLIIDTDDLPDPHAR